MERPGKGIPMKEGMSAPEFRRRPNARLKARPARNQLPRVEELAGLIGWDQEGRFADGFVGQFRQTLLNTVAILKEADARPEHIVRMTWYVVDRDLYLASLKELGAAYREVIGPVYPAMAVVQVVSLMEPDALIEIETTAVRP